MKQTDTLIVIGRSEIIDNELLDIVRNINGVKVAINQYLDFADYIAFIDNWMSDKCKHKTALTLKCFNVPNSESYEVHTGDISVLDDKLKYCGFTHDFVLSWAILKGFKNVILIGVADFVTDKHYNSSEKFSPSESCIIESIEYINSLPIDIYTINPNSKLSVNKITKGELKLWQYQQE